MKHGAQRSKWLMLSAGGAAATAVVCWTMFVRLTSSTQAKAAMPLETRKQKLADAEQKFSSMFAKVPVVTASKAAKLLQEQPEQYVLVDVRNSEEQQVSMLPGSRVLTTSEFEQQQDSYRDTTAICLCTVGYRSSQYAAALLDKGHKAVNLQGGILAWTHEGYPLVSGADRQQPTTQVHTYAKTWAYQADGYEPVYYQHSSFVMLRDLLDRFKKALTSG